MQQAVIRHAQNDMAHLPAQAEAPQPGLGDRFKAWVEKNKAGRPKLGAQIESMFREAVKDIQNTFHQVMYGQPQQHGEPGTPLNPTMQQVTKALGTVLGHDDMPANDNRASAGPAA